MGIQDLTKSIKKHAPDGIVNLTIDKLPGEIYGVDVLSYLYPSKYNASAKGKGSHIRFFFDLIVAWRNAGKTLVMVFDGNTSEVSAKSDTLKKRQEIRQQNQEIISEITARTVAGTVKEDDFIELEKATRNTIVISKEDIADLKTLFDFMNVSYGEAAGEADSLLAAMFLSGQIHGAVSEDTDMLTHGIDIVVRGLIDAANRSAGTVNMYCLSNILKGFKMTMTQFIDFCIMSGCDYCPRVPGVGPVSAFKHIAAGGTPLTLTAATENYETKYREAVRMFTEHQATVEISRASSSCADAQGLLVTWLASHTNMTEKTIIQKLQTLIKKS
jgi:flap endonuclease-1